MPDLILKTSDTSLKMTSWGPTFAAEAREKWLARTIDSPGTWTGDDDFDGDVGSFSSDAGFASPAAGIEPPECNQFIGGGGDDGGDDFGDDGDGGVPLPPPIGGDVGGGPGGIPGDCTDLDGDPILASAYQCATDVENAYFAFLAVLGSGLLVIVACGTPEPLEPIACGGAVLLFLAAIGFLITYAQSAAHDCNNVIT
jgi:hypothetical protein